MSESYLVNKDTWDENEFEHIIVKSNCQMFCFLYIHFRRLMFMFSEIKLGTPPVSHIL